MDFNCLIYGCVRGEGVPPYTRDSHESWERVLLERVKAATVKVWEAAGRPAEVVIGVDGVVPMAKIRQQRLRRFKSLWWAAEEVAAGVRTAGTEVWDTNAITPGTEFMEKLGVALRSLATAKGRGWTVSGADEAGEGEQKLMAWVRSRASTLPGKHIVVYGLDADLIVLSSLQVGRTCPTVGSWHLMREAEEFGGGPKKGASADNGSRGGGKDPKSVMQKGTFKFLDVQELLNHLVPANTRLSPADYILDYACGMSFLGNDFLPHSLSVKLREGGHDLYLEALQTLHASGQRLIDPHTGLVQAASCATLLAGWTESEEDWIAEGFAHKYKMKPPPPRNDTERLMSGVQNLPIVWKEESCMWTREAGMRPDWAAVYDERWLRGGEEQVICAEYMRGLQWIMDYYLGKPISYTWYYPWNLPPRWTPLRAAFLRTKDSKAPPLSLPVAPQEQLAMVLPMGSWTLVRDAKLRALPARAPHYWPGSFSFFSAGKRWMWECEAELPILTPDRMRSLIV